MKINTIFSFTALFVFAVISAAQAQNCATPPSCASLGYTLSAPKSIGWVCTACPFDPTKFACTKRPCPAGTYAGNSPLIKDRGTCGQPTSCERFYVVYGFSGDNPCVRTDGYFHTTGSLITTTEQVHW